MTQNMTQDTTQDIRDFLPSSCDVLALGEPTHQEPAFGRLRNALFAQLAGQGFRSIALETDRVAALTVDDYVQEGTGSLDAAMRTGFSHGFGDLAPNRELVAWMRAYNENRPPEERLAFHGIDAQAENTSAPSPLRYLDHARAYLGADTDLAGLAGDDERWSRTQAILDPAASVGATAEAESLRVAADDLLVSLYARAPELIAATSHAAWHRARTHLTAGLGLLRYHKVAAQPVEESLRISRLLATRDALMAQNLLDIRTTEARRGRTLVFAHNCHLQRNPGRMRMAEMDVTWFSTGAIVSSLVGEEYAVIAGSLGRSEVLGLPEPGADTYEGSLQRRVDGWALTEAASVATARKRTDTTPEQGYFPLERAGLDGVDAIWHLTSGDVAPGPPRP
jgi:erythromycin esterase-like protein